MATNTKTTRRIDGTVNTGTPTSAIQPISTQPAGNNVVPISSAGGAMRGAGAATPNAYKDYFGLGGAATQTSFSAPTSSAPYGGTFPRGEGYQGTGNGLYSYNDFLRALASSALADQFSPEDLALAEKYPEFGMGILTQKQKFRDATTDEQRTAANQAANALRSSYGNFSGGGNGIEFTPGGKIPGQIDNVLDSLYNFGEFSYGAAPTYTNEYGELQRQLLDSIVNRPDFTWTKEGDPLWGSYKKSYLREGERATDNALARAAAASGGRPSSYAINAATQAGDYYATQLNDIIPELYQQAYQRYLEEDSLRRKDLAAVNDQEQLAYQKFLNDLLQYNTDRSFAYQDYLDDYGRLQSTLGALQSQDQSDYDRWQDELNWQYQKDRDALADQRYDTEWNYGVGQDAQKLAQAQVDAMLQSGGMPSDDLLAAAGYTKEYANTLRAYYRQQIAAANAPRVVYRSSKSNESEPSGGDDTTTGEDKWDDLIEWVNKYGSKSAENYIQEHYADLGYKNVSTAKAAWQNYLTEHGVKDGFVPTKVQPLTGPSKHVAESVMSGGLDLMSGMVSGGLWGKNYTEALEYLDKAAKNGTVPKSELSAMLKYFGY